MIIRIKRSSHGVMEYLETANKKGRYKSRDEIDERIQIYGNRKLVSKTIEFLDKYKNYNTNYMHITVSFTHEEYNKLTTNEIKELALSVIKHYTSGYNIENEVIASAEVHYPKIKFDESEQERLPHVHIVIPLHNPLTNTQMTPPPYSSANDLIQTHLCQKYNLTIPLSTPRKQAKSKSKLISQYKDDDTKSKQTKIAKLRNIYANQLSDIETTDELKEYAKINQLQLKETKTKNNHYFSLIKDNSKVNLRGSVFDDLNKRLLNIKPRTVKIKNIHKQSPNEVIEQLNNFYQKRVEYIAKRNKTARAKANTRLSEFEKEVDTRFLAINKNDNNTNSHNTTPKKLKKEIKMVQYNKSNTPTIQLQYNNQNRNKVYQKNYKHNLIYKHYQYDIESDLTGYYIDIQKDKVILENKKENIKIIDEKHKIIAGDNNLNLQNKVKLALDIAVAKKMDLENLIINGSEEFKDETKRQISNLTNNSDEKEFTTKSYLPELKKLLNYKDEDDLYKNSDKSFKNKKSNKA